MLFSVFALKFTSTLTIDAMAAWPTLIFVIFALAQFWPTLIPPSSYQKATQCQNTRSKGEVWMHFMFSSQKCIQLTYKSSLLSICNFSHHMYLLIKICKHHTTINLMGTLHNKTSAEWCRTQQSTGSECISVFVYSSQKSVWFIFLNYNFKWFPHLIIIEFPVELFNSKDILSFLLQVLVSSLNVLSIQNLVYGGSFSIYMIVTDASSA